MRVRIERISKDIEQMALFSATPAVEGVTRFSYSPQDHQAKAYLISIMKELGMHVKIDATGNVRGRLDMKSPEKPAIWMGSHIDSVRGGGKFDGVLGVVSGLEVARVLVENKVQLAHPLEVIIFSEEEGSNLEGGPFGSRAMMGKYTLEDLKSITNYEGKPVVELLSGFGLSPENVERDILNPSTVKAMVELHIEQSIVLESKDIAVGIVQGIAGVSVLRAELIGEANHAGGTPMNLRKDTVVALGSVIASIKPLIAQHGTDQTVATIGKVQVWPDSHNVIAEKTIFTVDIRDTDNQIIENMEKAIRSSIAKAARENHLKVEISKVGESPAVTLSNVLIDAVEKVAKKEKMDYIKMHSGAIHDTATLAEEIASVMIFVRSKDGKSHSPKEYTSYEDIEIGANLLLKSILEIDEI